MQFKKGKKLEKLFSRSSPIGICQVLGANSGLYLESIVVLSSIPRVHPRVGEVNNTDVHGKGRKPRELSTLRLVSVFSPCLAVNHHTGAMQLGKLSSLPDLSSELLVPSSTKPHMQGGSSRGLSNLPAKGLEFLVSTVAHR
jgi:hypothetical protein